MSTNLLMDLRAGDRLVVGDAVISVLEKSGRATRICITSPGDLAIWKRAGAPADSGAPAELAESDSRVTQ